ncbi:MAG: flagellar assembly protein FliW [Desulfobacterales bacterium]
MKTLQTRFGEINYDPARVIHFPEGLIGFERLRDFIVMPNKNDDVLFCFQSVEEPHVAFLLINPSLFFADYQVVVSSEIKNKLGTSANDPYFILTTITFHQDDSVSLNLLAPIVYTPKTDRAIQIVLENSSFSTKTPLPIRLK